MFFIPIAAIVIFIWLIVNAVQGGRMARLQMDTDKSIAKTKQLQETAVDMDASYLVQQQLRKPQDQRKAVSEFMGGREDWDLYASNLDKDSLLVLSMNALLVRQGHVSSSLASCVGTSFYGRDPAYFSAQQWRSMTEQVLLAFEKELNKRDIPAVVLCEKSYPGTVRVPEQSLRSYIDANGPGSTEAFSYRMSF